MDISGNWIVVITNRIGRIFRFLLQYKHPAVVVAALIPTPLLIFISSSVSLYLGNQELLGSQARVLVPFAAVFMVVLGGGIFAYYAYHKRKNLLTRMIVWLYFIAGPAFLFYESLKMSWPFLERAVGALTVSCFFLIIGILLLRFIEPRRAISYFALFGLLLAVYEIVNFVTASGPAGSREDTTPAVRLNIPETTGTGRLPNIYHIVLDEFQTDMFEQILTEEVKNALGGFIYYPENIANYGGTLLSIPSVFTGTRYEVGNASGYHRAAFQDGPSMLIPLKKAGYKLWGFVLNIGDFYPFQLKLFDHLTDITDKSFFRKFGSIGITFRILWTYRNLPAFLHRFVIPPDDLQSLRNMQGLPSQFGLLSRHTFLNYPDIEKNLPSENRYTYMHLILPHSPYILSADCSYCQDGNGIKKTSPGDQARCTIKLVIKFIRALKTYGRFENALIVIHADHGRRRDLSDITSRELANDASRALLLLKPAGRSPDVPFETSPVNSMLIDIPSTILDAVGIEPLSSFEGRSLVNPSSLPEERTRFFMIYDDTKFVFYNIEGKKLVLDRIIER